MPPQVDLEHLEGADLGGRGVVERVDTAAVFKDTFSGAVVGRIFTVSDFREVGYVLGDDTVDKRFGLLLRVFEGGDRRVDGLQGRTLLPHFEMLHR